ncbi:hypothetical protein I4U23_022185 [Adineta vaga]|nr:hypothetical protein I4U23_022185 [Adineta vaga]
MHSSAIFRFAAIIMLVSLIHMSSSARIEIYDHKNHHGMKLVDRSLGDHDGTCFNVEGWANDRASSVNTHGSCFMLFEHHSCHGGSMEAAPGTPCHSNFRECNFNDKLTSYRLC